MELLYYPGCTLKEYARGFDATGRQAAEALGVHLHEMDDWTCCGTTLPLTSRLIAGLVAPARILVETERAGHDQLSTLCSFCYNVLKRTNRAIRDDAEQRTRLNAYLADEYDRKGESWQDYEGQVEVLHLLEVIRDRIGFDAVRDHVKRPLRKLRVAPYYGCLLLRPHDEVGFDDPERPTVLENLLQALGCEVVDFPHKVECCGSYLGLSAPDVALETSHNIVSSARAAGADVVALACPLCAYNLDSRQAAMHERFAAFPDLPVVYFTELMALALSARPETVAWDQHTIDPQPLLQSKQLV
jgi:heterodisulfide reductase subunit B